MENNHNSGFDVQLDEAEIKLDVPLYCYTCYRKMERIGPMRYKCLKCGFEFEEKG